MDFQTLYNFTYSLTKLYDEANDRCALVEGFNKALSLFFPIEELKVYLIDEYSFLLKDFTKPWENLTLNDENTEIKKHFDNFLVQKSQYEIIGNFLYFPIVQKHKTLGLVKICARENIKEKNEFFNIFPLVTAQISMFITTLKNSEQIKISLALTFFKISIS